MLQYSVDSKTSQESSNDYEHKPQKTLNKMVEDMDSENASCRQNESMTHLNKSLDIISENSTNAKHKMISRAITQRLNDIDNLQPRANIRDKRRSEIQVGRFSAITSRDSSTVKVNTGDANSYHSKVELGSV